MHPGDQKRLTIATGRLMKAVRSGLPKIGPRRSYNDAWMRKLA